MSYEVSLSRLRQELASKSQEVTITRKKENKFSFKKMRCVKRNMCGERGSNTRPSDLQSDALPTELSPQARIIATHEYFTYL